MIADLSHWQGIILWKYTNVLGTGSNTSAIPNAAKFNPQLQG